MAGEPIVYVIDAESANKQKRTGVEEYAFQLIQAMKRDPLKEGESVFLYSPTPLSGSLADLPPGWESHVLNWKFSRGWMQGRVSWELFRHRPQALFVPSQGLPRFCFDVPILTTIHDVAFHRIRPLYDPAIRRRLARVTKRSIKKAARLLAVSEFTKQELRDLYSVSGDRVTVTPLAADRTVYRRMEDQTVESVLRKHRLGRTFFLFVSRLEKKKNVAMLVRAFELFKQNRGVGDPYELVLVGEQGYGYHEMKTLIEHSPQRELIREMGYLPDEDVSALMNITAAFCFPSFYEGFGISNVEAMACGTALILSDLPVHHEVVGDGAIYVSPQEPENWAKQMERVVNDSLLRDQLIRKGMMRIAQFSWDKTAHRTWEILRSLV